MKKKIMAIVIAIVALVVVIKFAIKYCEKRVKDLDGFLKDLEEDEEDVDVLVGDLD